MKALPRYTVVTLLIVTVAFAGSWPFLDAAGLRGLGVAAALTVPVQLGLFALLSHARTTPMLFMAWWAVGILARMVVVAAVGIGVAASGIEALDPTVTVMGTVSLFFIFLLLEPVFLMRDGQLTEYAR